MPIPPIFAPRSMLRAALRQTVALLLLLGTWGCGSKPAPQAGGFDLRKAVAQANEVAAARNVDWALLEKLVARLTVASLKAQHPADRLAAARSAASLRLRLYRTTHEALQAERAIELLKRARSLANSAEKCELRLQEAKLSAEVSNQLAPLAASLAELRRAPLTPQCRQEVARVEAQLGAILPKVASTSSKGSTPAGSSAMPPARLVPAQTLPDIAVASPKAPPPSAKPVRLLGVETFGDPHGARVVVRLSGPTSFELGQAPATSKSHGPRLYLDVARLKLGKARRRRRGKGLVKRIRLGQHKRSARIVLDLERLGFRRVFYLPEPFRIIIDVSERAPRNPRAGRPNRPGGRNIQRVVIDPGHGGQDPGAKGPGGLQEKDVTLDIAHRLAPILARELGITTLLTRDQDGYVPLEERTLRANAFGADLFLSIHCNAAHSAEAKGVQTYVLDATDNHRARKLAARENAAGQGRLDPHLLKGLKLAHFDRDSRHFANLLQRATLASLQDKYRGVVDGGVHRAGFYVLVGAQMPAVLFESSFISNPTEEERLRSKDYRQRLANGIANAIRAYRDGLLVGIGLVPRW